MKKSNSIILLQKNKKAYFDYEVLDSWEAGIELKGYEVKQIKNKKFNLKGSYITKINNELFIRQMHVSLPKSLPFKNESLAYRDRKIFLKRKVIDYLIGKMKEKGFTVIPLEVYLKNNLIKVKVGLVKGRKKFEKKQVLKERALDKEAKIAMKKAYL